MAADDPDPVDELFALAPEDFTAARDALARRLRREGEREAAAAVRVLRRPTLAAWALNQVVRRHRDEVEVLVRSGEALAEAQREALGGSAGPLRETTRARSAQLRRVAALAAEVLGTKAAEAHRSDVAGTLTAASTDPAAGAQLLAGRLSGALAVPAGFTFGFGAASAEGTAEPGAAGARSRAKGKASPKAAADAESARAEADAAARAEAARRAASLRVEADRARGAAEQARHAADVAAERVATLEAELAEARDVAEAATTAAADAAAAATVAARAAAAAQGPAGNKR